MVLGISWHIFQVHKYVSCPHFGKNGPHPFTRYYRDKKYKFSFVQGIAVQHLFFEYNKCFEVIEFVCFCKICNVAFYEIFYTNNSMVNSYDVQCYECYKFKVCFAGLLPPRLWNMIEHEKLLGFCWNMLLSCKYNG